MTSPLYEIAGPNLIDLLKLLAPFANSVYLLRGKLQTPIYGIPDDIKQVIVNTDLMRRIKKNYNMVTRLASYGLAQLIVARHLVRIGQDSEVVLFYQSGLAIPAVTARARRKKVLVYAGGSGYRSLLAGKMQDKLLSLLLYAEEVIMATLAHKVIAVTRHIQIPVSESKVIEAPTRLLDDTFFEKYRRKKRPDGKVVVGYVGRFSPEKGVEELAEAFSIVVAKIPSARFLLVGDGPLKQKIEARLSERNNIRGKVQITGWVNNVQTYLLEMSLLVLPSKTEGLPNIILEAMACKTPVLASMVGAIPFILEEEVTGFLLRSLEPDYMAERIIDLCNKPELLQNVSSKAYVWLKENYSATTASDSWSKVFDSITRAP